MSNAETLSQPLMNVEEFLGWDGDGHQGKQELIDGMVRAMTPASETHGTIRANLAGLFWAYFRDTGGPCRAVMEAGVKPRIDPGHNLRVPDLVVTCENPTKDNRIVKQPIVLIEILSPSNDKETWESIRACATVPSLKEIVVADSEKLHIEVYRKDRDGNWPETSEKIEPDGILHLTSFGAQFPLRDVYANTYLIAGNAATQNDAS